VTRISPRRPDPLRPRKVEGSGETSETRDAKAPAGQPSVPDSFEKARPGASAPSRMTAGDVSRLKQALGPTEGKAAPSDLDDKLGRLFEKHGYPEARESAAKAGGLEAADRARLQKSVDRLKGHLATPTEASRNAVAADLRAMDTGHGDVMASLFHVFRESIEATNEDKRYFLSKLKMYNDMGEALSDYLSDLVDASRDLGALPAGEKYPEMVGVGQSVEIKKFDAAVMKQQVAGALQEVTAKETRGFDELDRVLDAVATRPESGKSEDSDDADSSVRRKRDD
jgi:hypothetical protein